MEFPTFKNTYNKPGIELLPHRSPFLFVDTLIAADESGAIGEYTYTEEKNDFFKGHFPDNPIVPGVVLVESMAQVAGAALVAEGRLASDPDQDAVFVLASVESARFRKPFHPGAKLTTVVTNEKVGSKLGVFSAKGYQDGELACECTVKCMLGSKSK